MWKEGGKEGGKGGREREGGKEGRKGGRERREGWSKELREKAIPSRFRAPVTS